MGSTLPPATESSRAIHELIVEVEALSGLERIDVIREDRVVHTVQAAGALGQSLRLAVRRLEPGEFLYVRAVQRDLGAAWSSPFFAD